MKVMSLINNRDLYGLQIVLGNFKHLNVNNPSILDNYLIIIYTLYFQKKMLQEYIILPRVL